MTKRLVITKEIEINSGGIATISFDKHISRLCFVTSKSNAHTAIGMWIIVTSVTGIINYIEIFKGSSLEITTQENRMTIRSTSSAPCNLILINLDSNTL